MSVEEVRLSCGFGSLGLAFVNTVMSLRFTQGREISVLAERLSASQAGFGPLKQRQDFPSELRATQNQRRQSSIFVVINCTVDEIGHSRHLSLLVEPECSLPCSQELLIFVSQLLPCVRSLLVSPVIDLPPLAILPSSPYCIVLVFGQQYAVRSTQCEAPHCNCMHQHIILPPVSQYFGLLTWEVKAAGAWG